MWRNPPPNFLFSLAGQPRSTRTLSQTRLPLGACRAPASHETSENSASKTSGSAFDAWWKHDFSIQTKTKHSEAIKIHTRTHTHLGRQARELPGRCSPFFGSRRRATDRRRSLRALQLLLLADLLCHTERKDEEHHADGLLPGVVYRTNAHVPNTWIINYCSVQCNWHASTHDRIIFAVVTTHVRRKHEELNIECKLNEMQIHLRRHGPPQKGAPRRHWDTKRRRWHIMRLRDSKKVYNKCAPPQEQNVSKLIRPHL